MKNEIFPVSILATFPLNAQAPFDIDSYWFIIANDSLSFFNDCRESSECVTACVVVQVIRNHELVSRLVLQQEASISRETEEPQADTQDHSNEILGVILHDREAKSQGKDGIGEDVPQIYDPNTEKEELPSKSSVGSSEGAQKRT